MRLLENLRPNQTDEDLLRQTTALTTAYLLERNRTFEAWLRRKIAQLEEYVTAHEMHEQELAGELGSATETIPDEAGASGWGWASSLDDMAAAGDDEAVPVETGESTSLPEPIPGQPDERDVAVDVTETMPTQNVDLDPAEPDAVEEDDEASSSDGTLDKDNQMDWQGWLLSGSETAPGMASDTSLEGGEVEAVDEPDLEAEFTTKSSDPIEVVDISGTLDGSAAMDQDVAEGEIAEDTAGQAEVAGTETAGPNEAGQSEGVPVVTVPPAEAELPAPSQAVEMELLEATAEPIEYFSLDELPELADPLEPAGDEDIITTEDDETDPDDDQTGIRQAGDPAAMKAGQSTPEAKLDPWESDLDYEGGLSEHI